MQAGRNGVLGRIHKITDQKDIRDLKHFSTEEQRQKTRGCNKQ